MVIRHHRNLWSLPNLAALVVFTVLAIPGKSPAPELIPVDPAQGLDKEAIVEWTRAAAIFLLVFEAAPTETHWKTLYEQTKLIAAGASYGFDKSVSKDTAYAAYVETGREFRRQAYALRQEKLSEVELRRLALKEISKLKERFGDKLK
ncbi:MAG: hypothetical protein ABL994_20305 [Verrucomicrobiales bacterium]